VVAHITATRFKGTHDYDGAMSPAAQLGFIVENIGGGEIILIVFLALVILGPDRIPEMARGAGRMINNLKKLGSDLSGDMGSVMNDPAMQPIRELGEFAVRPRQKLAEYALEAEAEERAKAAAKALEESADDDSQDSKDPPSGKAGTLDTDGTDRAASDS
jgi:sec-independent protein translocase protein TatB